MKAYITKYALTEGILEEEGVQMPNGDLCLTSGDRIGFLILKGDWHGTKDSAVNRAEVMRLHEISSLKKQIAKLEGMKFE